MAEIAKKPGRAVQGVMGLTAAMLAYAAFDYSAATNIRRGNPELAYRMRPTDPGTIAAVMNYRISAQVPFAANADDAANARAAIQQEPLNRTLVRTLAVQAELSGDKATAAKGMVAADRVSRRDTIAQLWLAEYYRRQNEPAKSLAHSNAAMLVKPDLQRVLIPSMIPLLVNSDFREALKPYIIAYSGWAVVLIGTATSVSREPVLLLMEPLAPKLSGGGYNLAFSKMIHQLSVRGEHQRAMALAGNAFSNFDPGAYGVLNWNAATADRRLGELSWKFSQSGGVVASVDNDRRLSISTLPFASGNAATRDVPVKPGMSFRFGHKFRYDTPSSKAKLRWYASCVLTEGDARFWKQDAPVSSDAGQFLAKFTVPMSCHLIRLTLQVMGADSQLASEIVLTDLMQVR